MSRAFTIALAMLLAGCGVQRPLIKPADVPAYEAARAKKMQERAQTRQEEEQSQPAPDGQ